NVFKQAFACLDEFQVLAQRNIEGFLEAARSHGLALTLAMQTPEKLDPQIREVVENNVAIRQYCTVRSPQQVAALTRMGGTTIEVTGVGRDGEPVLKEVPRLTENLLRRMSAEEDLSVLFVHKSADFGQFQGFPLVVRAPHCHDLETYKELKNRPWPMDEEGTLRVGRHKNLVDEHRLNKGASDAPAAGTPLDAAFGRIVVTDEGRIGSKRPSGEKAAES